MKSCASCRPYLLKTVGILLSVLLIKATPVHAQLTFKIAYRPHALGFGREVVLGTTGAPSKPKNVVLINQGTALISLAPPAASGDFIVDNASTTCGPTLAAKSKCDVAVVFQPTAIGKRTGVLTLVNDSSNAPKISVPLTGIGVPGRLTYHPKSIGFPRTLVGSTSSKIATVMLVNNNPIAMTISSIAASPSPTFAETNGCGNSLAAHSKCPVQVTFSPTSLGVQRGALTISDDAAGGSQKVALHGTGSAAPGARSNVGYVVMGSVINSLNQSALFAIPWLKTESFSDQWVIFPVTSDSILSLAAVSPLQASGSACVFAGGYESGNLYSYSFNPATGAPTLVSAVVTGTPDSFPNGTVRPNADYIYLLKNPSGTTWNVDVYLVAPDCSVVSKNTIAAPSAAISASTDSTGQNLFIVGDCPGNGGNSCIYTYSLTNPALPSATGTPLQLPDPGCRPSNGIVGVLSGFVPVPATEVLAAVGDACSGSGGAANDHILSYLYGSGGLAFGSTLSISPWQPSGLTAEPSGQWVYYSATQQTPTATEDALVQFDVDQSTGTLNESPSGPTLLPSSVEGGAGAVTFGKDTMGHEWIFEAVGNGAAAWALDPASGSLTFKATSPAPLNFEGGLTPETLGFVP